MSLAARALQTRWLVRAPIWVFRLRLGFLFGGRLLLLEHIGRTSGEWRYVVLECVERRTPTRIVIASGFGARAQWLRNLRANPGCRVSIGTRYRRAATARELDSDEAAETMTRYRQEHPTAYRELSGVIEESIGGSIDDVPLVELQLTDKS